MPVRRKRNSTLRFKPDLWGRVPAEDGVLFDGTISLTDTGGGTLLGTPVGALAPQVGVTYDITINGTTKQGTAQGAGDDAVIQVGTAGDVIMYGSNSGTVMFMCTSNYGEAGDNTLTVAESE